MRQQLIAIISAAAMVAVPLVALTAGLSTGRPGVIRVIAQPRLLGRFASATFVVMPVIAFVLAHMLPAFRAMWVALVMISITPPSPGLRRKLLANDADTSTGIAWQAVALLLSFIMIPITIFLARHLGGLDLRLGYAPVIDRMLVSYVAPVSAGIVLRTAWPAGAIALLKVAGPLGVALQAALLLVIGVVGIPSIVGQGAAAIGLELGFAATAVGVGHVFGGPDPARRRTLAASLATRWPAPALIFAKINGTMAADLPAIVTYLAGGAVCLALYVRWSRREAAGATNPPADQGPIAAPVDARDVPKSTLTKG